MLTILRSWVDRYFSDEETVLLQVAGGGVCDCANHGGDSGSGDGVIIAFLLQDWCCVWWLMGCRILLPYLWLLWC